MRYFGIWNASSQTWSMSQSVVLFCTSVSLYLILILIWTWIWNKVYQILKSWSFFLSLSSSSTGKWNLQAFIDRFHLGKPVASLQFLTQNYHDWGAHVPDRKSRCRDRSVCRFCFAITKQLPILKKRSGLLLPLSYRRGSWEISSLCYNIWWAFLMFPSPHPLPPPTLSLSRGVEQGIGEIGFWPHRGFLISFQTLSAWRGKRADITSQCGKSWF